MSLGVSEPLTMVINCQMPSGKRNCPPCPCYVPLEKYCSGARPSENGSSQILSMWPSVLRWPLLPWFMKAAVHETLSFSAASIPNISYGINLGTNMCSIEKRNPLYLSLFVFPVLTHPQLPHSPIVLFLYFISLELKKILWCSKRLDATRLSFH